MVLSFAATNIQLGLLLHAGVVMTALKLSAALSTCDRAMKMACSADKSAAKYSRNLAGSTYVNPSAVFFIAPDLLRSLEKRFPSSARRIRARFRNYGSPIAVCDKDARSVLQREDAPHGGHVITE